MLSDLDLDLDAVGPKGEGDSDPVAPFLRVFPADRDHVLSRSVTRGDEVPDEERPPYRGCSFAPAVLARRSDGDGDRPEASCDAPVWNRFRPPPPGPAAPLGSPTLAPASDDWLLPIGQANNSLSSLSLARAPYWSLVCGASKSAIGSSVLCVPSLRDARLLVNLSIIIVAR